MESTPVWAQTIPCVSTDPDTDFTDTIRQCEHLAAVALETEHASSQREMYQRLHHGLSELLPGLNDPVPAHMVDRLTVETPPTRFPTLDSESDLLCEYCIALSHLLSGGKMSVTVEETLQGLLYELTAYLADIMNAPRWLRTPNGLQHIAP